MRLYRRSSLRNAAAFRLKPTTCIATLECLFLGRDNRRRTRGLRCPLYTERRFLRCNVRLREHWF
nr:MAG TPA: hypothetical protein [Caudoviricetes sp.]